MNIKKITRKKESYLLGKIYKKKKKYLIQIIMMIMNKI